MTAGAPGGVSAAGGVKAAGQPASGSGAASAGQSWPRKAAALAIRYPMLWGLVALVIAAQILYPGFLDSGNIRNLLSQNAPVGIVAVGMTFVILAGGFDLSVGATYALGAVLFAGLAGDMPIALAGVAAVGAGVVAGLLNGLVVTRLRVNAFVATLGSASIFGAIAFIYSDSSPIVVDKPGFEILGSDELAGIPLSVILLAAALLAGGLVLARSVYGRNVYAVGGNDEAARLAGIRVDRVRTVTYMIAGACAVVGGMIFASRLGVGQAEIQATIALDAIAIVIIGGTSLMGGEGAMWRTAVGLLILATLNNLFQSLSVPAETQNLAKGAIIIGAVALDSLGRRRER